MNSLRRFVLTAIALAFGPAVFAQMNVKTITPTFTTVDVAGATVTAITGINTTGDMVGWYSNVAGGYCPCHSFSLKDRNFTFFDYPGAASTLANAINDSGLIVGDEGDPQNINDQGFVYDGA